VCRTVLIAALLTNSAISAAEFRSGRYLGRDVVFQNIAGSAIYQGDILLGETETVAGATAKSDRHKAPSFPRSASGRAESFLT
jgi:hypothetical protein